MFKEQKTQRLLYPDTCKFIAIFIVTWSHCAQCISGEVWTNFIGGGSIDIAFNMPLFMLMSGWFINPDQMRKSKIGDFAISKFKRLIVPSFVWYFIHQLLVLHLPGLSIFGFYWYLNALFVCLCVIMLTTKVFKSNMACCIVSTVGILFIPYSDFSHINFMLPFLWAGYGLRKLLSTKYATPFVIACTLLGALLCLFWNPVYTVYKSPLNSLYISFEMIMVYVYRFVIGFTISAVIIYLLMKTENTILKRLSPLGSYSLVIYTSSLVLLGVFSKYLNFIDIHTNAYGLIDVLSLCLCITIIFVTTKFSDLCRKNSLLSTLFLGE